MPTFIMLSTLTPDGVQTLRNNPTRIREVNQELEQLGATVKAQWATLGQYDFVNVVEAPDEKTMAVSLEPAPAGPASGRRWSRSRSTTSSPRCEGPRGRRRGARARHRARARALAAGPGDPLRAREPRHRARRRGCCPSR